MPPRSLHTAFVLLLLALAAAPMRAQNDVTPLDPNFKHLPEIARRTGAHNSDLGRCEAYGMSVCIIERERLEQRPRSVVVHILCETAVTAQELLMYDSGDDTIPRTTAARRIGPTDINFSTNILTSADHGSAIRR